MTAWSRRLRRGLISARDRAFFLAIDRLGLGPSPPAVDPQGDSTTTLIVMPLVPGNLGDEAMVVGCLLALQAATPGARATVLTRDIPFAGLAHPHLRQDTITWRAFPKVRGLGAATLAALTAHFMQASSILVIGADVIDGTYNPRLIAVLLDACRHAAERGTPVTIIGCSVHAFHPGVLRRAARLPPTVRFCIRDQRSHARARQACPREYLPVADAAFLLEPHADARLAEPLRRIAHCRALGAPVVAINLNIMRLHNHRLLCAEMLTCIRALHPEALLVGIGHDQRPGNDDWQSFTDGTPNLVIAPRSIRAWEAKHLVGQVDLTISGRMHLAIASLGSGTPALGISYLGKFDGMFAHFGYRHAPVVEAEGLTPARLTEAFLAMMRDLDHHRQQVRAHLPAVRLQAALNLPRGRP